ncbi:integrase [Staphylococcus epidermidis]|nr:integrase [Staphylococcus epidermidis]MCO6332621.1 integrase [Staphylococcus epidermidis]MCO6338892.1 integrase [Staphylococcus epidermidis]
MSLTEYKKLKLFSTCKNELSYLAIFILIVAGGPFGEVQNYNITI